ncbi:MAG: aldo/keto reductase [Flavobacteriaceae bacterium]
MHKIKLADNLEISRIVHGHWRLADWQLSNQELLTLINQCIDLGITTFDHADIYGDYSCEKLFGNALKLNKTIRNKIQIITKCGVKLVSDKFPERQLKVYDYSFDYIVNSVENSLKNLGADYLDILLLHRPSPFFNPSEVAKAFLILKKEGKVLNFGVSNFTVQQFEMLNAFVEEPLVTNQVEISPYCLEHFENGNIDFFLKENIKPMAWSPLAGGNLLNPKDAKGKRIHNALIEVASELNTENLDQIIYSWLLSHPASIIPVIGSGKIERLKLAAESLSLNMSLEQWFKIYTAATGVELP